MEGADPEGVDLQCSKGRDRAVPAGEDQGSGPFGAQVGRQQRGRPIAYLAAWCVMSTTTADAYVRFHDEAMDCIALLESFNLEIDDI